MTRAAWTAEELRGHDTVFLVDLQFAGRTHRLATREVTVRSVAGTDAAALHYPGTLDAMTWARTLDLFNLEPEPGSIDVSGTIAEHVAARLREGHALEGAVCQVSQVRVLHGGDVAVDAYPGRLVCLTGVVRASEYGAASVAPSTAPASANDGTRYVSYLRFEVERVGYDSSLSTSVPSEAQRVVDATWIVDGRLGDGDVGVYYPIVIGYPGRYDGSPDGWVTGAIGVWLNKQRLYNVLCVGLGRIEAATVMLNTDDDPWGTAVNVRYTYTNAGAIVDAVDSNGQLLAVIDYNQDDYGLGDANDLGVSMATTSYYPSVNSTDHVFVGYPAGSGGMLWRGRVLRDAGDVIEWALERAGIPVDYASLAASRDSLSRFKIDTVISEAVPVMDWVERALMPLLPASLTYSDQGAGVWVWDPNAGPSDAVAHLNADTDGRIDCADTVTIDADNVVNSLTLDYAYSVRAEQYTHTERLGPAVVASTARAKHRLRFNLFNIAGTDNAVMGLHAVERGAGGRGITVTCTVGGAVTSVTDGVASVAIHCTTAGAGETVQTLCDRINADSALITASTSNTTALPDGEIIGTSTASVALVMNDYGTRAHPACTRSYAAVNGAREYAAETMLVYDASTALAAIEWRAAAFALPHRRLALTAPESEYGWLRLGDLVQFTRADLAFAADLGIVESIEVYSDGMIGLRLVFIDR